MTNVTPLSTKRFTKQQTLSLFFTEKRAYRKLHKEQERACRDLCLLKRELKRLGDSDIFSAKKLTAEIASLERIKIQLRVILSTIGSFLVSSVHDLDERFELTLHEKAAALSISHIALKQCIKKDGDTSLFELAFGHAEVYGERGDFIGATDNRDYPVFSAIEHYMIEMMTSKASPEVRATIDQKTKEHFGSLPQYQAVKEPDGTLTVIPAPPNLKLIH
ncbi:MAG: hypothetical protein RPU34_04360 [Candidatus Sedimenticola sp. (ex Thyasira tokunagai)]